VTPQAEIGMNRLRTARNMARLPLWLHLIPFVLLLTLATGCQTTVGNYLGNRGREMRPAQIVVD